ncbi:MAG: hypothetical protein AAF611_07885 [Bacteroidota bacterium]
MSNGKTKKEIEDRLEKTKDILPLILHDAHITEIKKTATVTGKQISAPKYRTASISISNYLKHVTRFPHE